MVFSEDRLRDRLIRGLAGESAAYHEFLSELGGRLRAYFRRRLSRLPEEVEDLVQETMLAVHIQRHTYDTDQPLTAWVHAIARYKMIDMLRRRSRTEMLTDPLDDAAEVFSAIDDSASEAKRDLGRLLELLPERQRAPIVYVKVEGMSVLETSKITGQSVSAVKVNVHRGLKALAAMIRDERR